MGSYGAQHKHILLVPCKSVQVFYASVGSIKNAPSDYISLLSLYIEIYIEYKNLEFQSRHEFFFQKRFFQ